MTKKQILYILEKVKDYNDSEMLYYFERNGHSIEQNEDTDVYRLLTEHTAKYLEVATLLLCIKNNNYDDLNRYWNITKTELKEVK